MISLISRAIVFTTLVSLTVWLIVQRERPAFAQGGPAPPAAGQGPARGGRGGGPQRGAAVPQTAQGSATNDLTGYWVRLITEDWRWLMVVPPKGDASSIGGGMGVMNAAGMAVANAWDPAKDEAEGNQCKGYGAGAISRLPTRAHVTWQDGDTLKWETDQGMQTRAFKFGAAAQELSTNPGARSWQGFSLATWEPTAGGRGAPGGGRGGPPALPGAPVAGPAAPTDDAPAPPPGAAPALPAGGRGGNAQSGWLKVVTTNLKSGYLRKNGVPYSEKATVTEYFQPTPETYGTRYMVVTTIIEDPEYLNGPLITSSNYKKLPDTNNGWDPTPCSVR